MRHGRIRIATIALFVLIAGAVGMGLTVPAAAQGVIQPGSALIFGGESFCTANWVYDGPGGPYLGSAAHCSSGVGQQVDLASGSLGTSEGRIGQVAFISPNLDYLLIRLDAGVLGQVVPSMAGHPEIPTGVSTLSSASQGDLVQFSGHGIVFDLTTVTQQERVGILNFFQDGYQYVIGAVTPGDSGGPVGDITDGNKALGIVDTVGVIVAFPNANVGEGGVAVYALLADAAANGFPISLRTV
jgi:hypothetical protein